MVYFMVRSPLHPGNDEPLMQQSCTRKFPTARCPSKIDALGEVLDWIYTVYNRRNPTAVEERPPAPVLKEYLDKFT